MDSNGSVPDIQQLICNQHEHAKLQPGDPMSHSVHPPPIVSSHFPNLIQQAILPFLLPRERLSVKASALPAGGTQFSPQHLQLWLPETLESHYQSVQACVPCVLICFQLSCNYYLNVLSSCFHQQFYCFILFVNRFCKLRSSGIYIYEINKNRQLWSRWSSL